MREKYTICIINLQNQCAKNQCAQKYYRKTSLRIKTCPYCGYVINRDIGGSRNIFCKTVVQLQINIPGNLSFVRLPGQDFPIVYQN